MSVRHAAAANCGHSAAQRSAVEQLQRKAFAALAVMSPRSLCHHAGSRFFAAASFALVTPLPLLPLVPHLLVQALCVGMVRANPSLCGMPLLAHPLSAQRISAFHATMRLLTVVLPGGECGTWMGAVIACRSASPTWPLEF